jgi:hypothetical protein
MTEIGKQVVFAGFTCNVSRAKYANGQNSLTLIDSEDGSPIATASVSMPNEQCADNEVFIKNYSENEGVLEALVDAGYIIPFDAIPAGFTVIIKCKLNG